MVVQEGGQTDIAVPRPFSWSTRKRSLSA